LGLLDAFGQATAVLDHSQHKGQVCSKLDDCISEHSRIKGVIADFVCAAKAVHPLFLTVVLDNIGV